MWTRIGHRCSPTAGPDRTRSDTQLSRRPLFLLVSGRGVLVVVGSPDRIRTGATALRGRRPRPLDDGAAADRTRLPVGLTGQQAGGGDGAVGGGGRHRAFEAGGDAVGDALGPAGEDDHIRVAELPAAVVAAEDAVGAGAVAVVEGGPGLGAGGGRQGGGLGEGLALLEALGPAGAEAVGVAGHGAVGVAAGGGGRRRGGGRAARGGGGAPPGDARGKGARVGAARMAWRVQAPSPSSAWGARTRT